MTTSPISKYDNITSSRPWRHTVGRFSCAVRVPLYITACALQALKMGAKFFISCLTFGQLHRFEATKDWTFKGLLRDQIVLKHMGIRGINSFLTIFVAPPRNYESLGKAVLKCARLVFTGNYHSIINGHEDFSTIKSNRYCRLGVQIFEKTTS